MRSIVVPNGAGSSAVRSRRNARERARTAAGGTTPLRVACSWLVWPALVGGTMLGGVFAFEAGYDPTSVGIGAFALTIVALLVLERLMPFEPAWRESDGQQLPNVLHGISGGIASVLANAPILAASLFAATWIADRNGSPLWPDHWPVPAQIALLFVCSELATYWLHRWMHEVPSLWRFHAIHHSAPRMTWLSSSRNHAVDAIWNVSLSLPLPVLLGCPSELLVWPALFGLPSGFINHSNVEVRCGLLNYVFTTPEVHRWHHSRDPREGNTNYGPLLLIWDQLFGTFYFPARRPPVDVGTDLPVSRRFWRQLVDPFARKPRVDDPVSSLPVRSREEAANP